ncbi:MAG: hypothetical protein LBF44_01000 [Holosporaceae bacterium]|jgi:ABC-type phosphate/phosphonate transport system ATPase subunit|nr:hypothetical protein [Holosporaceae bacterium]
MRSHCAARLTRTEQFLVADLYRIGIIGRNGGEKSSLLKMIMEKNSDVLMGYIPQIIDDFASLSGVESASINPYHRCWAKIHWYCCWTSRLTIWIYITVEI